jgi:hypothetical protein
MRTSRARSPTSRAVGALFFPSSVLLGLNRGHLLDSLQWYRPKGLYPNAPSRGPKDRAPQRALYRPC